MKRIFKFLSCFFILLSIFANAEEQKKPVRVYADMVGDMFHAGHIEFLKKARAFGDYMVVGVHRDEVVEEYKRTPILTMEERVAIISACRYVDEVVVDAPLNPTKEYLEEHQISVVVHGDDFNPQLIHDQYSHAIELGIFRSVPYTPGISTTNIIQRIVERYNAGEFKKS